MVKGVLTDRGFANAVDAQQMFGGHGYIEEWGMSQFVRDARIAQIYEGANGIQAMDLVGRKLPRDGGRAMMRFLAEVEGFCKENAEDETLKAFCAPLTKSLGHLQQATMWLMQNAMAKPDNAGAAATDYMHLMGLVALGYMWGRIAKATAEKRRSGEGIAERLDARLATGRFYVERVLPETGTRLARISPAPTPSWRCRRSCSRLRPVPAEAASARMTWIRSRRGIPSPECERGGVRVTRFSPNR